VSGRIWLEQKSIKLRLDDKIDAPDPIWEPTFFGQDIRPCSCAAGASKRSKNKMLNMKVEVALPTQAIPITSAKLSSGKSRRPLERGLWVCSHQFRKMDDTTEKLGRSRERGLPRPLRGHAVTKWQTPRFPELPEILLRNLDDNLKTYLGYSCRALPISERDDRNSAERCCLTGHSRLKVFRRKSS